MGIHYQYKHTVVITSVYEWGIGWLWIMGKYILWEGHLHINLVKWEMSAVVIHHWLNMTYIHISNPLSHVKCKVNVWGDSLFLLKQNGAVSGWD